MFNNTEIAFLSKSEKELLRAYYLFKTIEKPWIVNWGNKLLSFAIFVRFPVKWILKPTIFSHFCGGETIEECKKTISNLAESNIGSILDYSAEGNQKESDFDFVMNEILQVIEISKINTFIPFAVFKVTGVARFELLEKVNSKMELTAEEKIEYNKLYGRVDTICKAAFQAELPILIDAEESWIQDVIDKMTIEMMQKYNHTKAIVYNTLQLYRHDRIAFLNNSIEHAKEKQYFLGLKLVRGAYIEKERERALVKGYLSPVHINKESTDKDYDKAIEICLTHSDIVSICAGSHNENSNALLAKLIVAKQFKKEDKRFYFAQLLGMSDHISYNLVHNGYNVAKYVPFGPVKSVMPYLIRRAQENTSISGQTGRELKLIKYELKRRNH
ncbi:MAG: proline dehydrogenase family protein [Bacteroidetes bacterium]|nr:proline dehydrogenase family protein [Bacteroidota bacterium]